MQNKNRRRAAAMLFAWAFASGALAADMSPITRIEPEFPREAVVAGADAGHVRARMTVDASGEVTRVEILEANPRRLFERAVVKTLSQWRFAPGVAGRLMEIDIDFHR